MLQPRICALLTTSLIAGATATAGLFDDVYRGLQVFATPSGSPILATGNGTRVNGARTGRLRIVPDRVGRGWTLELNRGFGNDSSGRPEVLDLGAIDLELSGTMDATMGYTRRGFLIGNGELNFNNLQYTLRAKTGLQDAELTGTFAMQSTIEINQFGFYETTLNISNANAQILVDGVIARDSEDVSFDIGPIVIEGNVFFDLTLALLTGLGVNTDGLEQLSPKSPIDRIDDAIEEALRDHAVVSGFSLTADANGEYLLTPLNPVGPPLPAGQSSAVAPLGLTDPGDPNSIAVPEPGTMILITLGGMGYWATRRRRA